MLLRPALVSLKETSSSKLFLHLILEDGFGHEFIHSVTECLLLVHLVRVGGYAANVGSCLWLTILSHGGGEQLADFRYADWPIHLRETVVHED